MSLKSVVLQQDPFNYGSKEYSSTNYYDSFGLEFLQDHDYDHKPNIVDQNLCMHGEKESLFMNGYLDNSPTYSVVAQTTTNTTSSTETCSPTVAPIAPAVSRRKRRRTKCTKNVVEMENQRMTHIAVERNRRRQMNDYLAVLRSLMPPSYAQRGDQASIVGGAINYVKELEQLLQFLESHKPVNNQQQAQPNANIFSNFFTFPQYSISPNNAVDAAMERRPGIADIEVTMAESHANIKILSQKRPKQLLKIVAGFQSIGLTILHLNITTVDQSVLYSLSVKVEDECQMTTVNDIATAVHEMLGIINYEEESLST